MSIEETQPENTPALIDLHSINFFAEDVVKDRVISCVLAHEDQSGLAEKLISKTGKSTEQLAAEIEKYEKGNPPLFFNSEDWRSIRLQEKQHRPRLFICKFKGSLKELNRWIFGEQIYDADGLLKTVAPSHLRTWAVGSTSADGRPLLSQDYQEQLAYYRKSDKFSEVVEIATWEEFKKLR